MAFTMTINVQGNLSDDNLLFQTGDATADRIGKRIEDHMGLLRGVSRVYYYKATSIFDTPGTPTTDIVVLVEKRRTSYAVSLPGEAEHIPIPVEARPWIRRDFAANFLPAFVSDDGEMRLSEAGLTLIDDLVDKKEVRRAFYEEKERPTLLAGYGLRPKEAEALATVDPEKAWLFCAEVDLIAADKRYRDNACYVLFEGDAEFGLPDPDWLRAARRYLAHFRANYGHYTSNARVYKQVLVVGREPLSPVMQRMVRYLNHRGVDAQSLTAAEAQELEAKLNALIEADYPLPQRHESRDLPPDPTQQSAA